MASRRAFREASAAAEDRISDLTVPTVLGPLGQPVGSELDRCWISISETVFDAIQHSRPEIAISQHVAKLLSNEGSGTPDPGK